MTVAGISLRMDHYELGTFVYAERSFKVQGTTV